MTGEERGHFFIANELASVSLIDPTPDGCTCFVI
jgi:hypothetical protein